MSSTSRNKAFLSYWLLFAGVFVGLQYVTGNGRDMSLFGWVVMVLAALPVAAVVSYRTHRQH